MRIDEVTNELRTLLTMNKRYILVGRFLNNEQTEHVIIGECGLKETAERWKDIANSAFESHRKVSKILDQSDKLASSASKDQKFLINFANSVKNFVSNATPNYTSEEQKVLDIVEPYAKEPWEGSFYVEPVDILE